MPQRSAVASSSAGVLEVKPGDRRALRRSVRMQCDVLADVFDDTIAHVMTDLSPFGAWIDTLYPLEPGAELLVSLTPPGARDGAQDVVLAGRVARASLGRRRTEGGRSGMGVAFDATELERARLSAALRGLPPPLPSRRAGGFESGVAWLDLEVVYEEEHGDRTSVLSMMESVACYLDEADALAERELEGLVAASELLTGGRLGPRWSVALRC